MKSIIYIFILGSLLGYSQHTVVLPIEGSRLTPEGEIPYFKDVNNLYNKFLGDWKYVDPNNASTYLDISIMESLYSGAGTGSYSDDIYLQFKYVENGQVIYDSSVYTEEELKRKIVGTAVDANKCSLFYREPTNLPFRYKSVRQHGVPTLYLRHATELTPNNGSLEKLYWDVEFVLGENEVWPFKIPNNIYLIRI